MAVNALISIRQRIMSVTRDWRLIVRLSIAPAAAWWLSLQLFDHSQGFFAPIAAVLTLTVGAGERVPIVVEIIVGAAVGILVGELLIYFIGRGSWQLMVVVALAVISARFVRLPGLALTQAVISGVLLVVIVPAPGITDPALTRFVDALLGGAVALATIVVIPANPLRDLDKGIAALLDELSAILSKTAQALSNHDPSMAARALEQARATQPMVTSVGTMADSVVEMSRLSPFRWRQREELRVQARTLTDLDHAVRNTRVLARRAAAMLRHGEVAPDGLSQSLMRLAELASHDPHNVEALIDVAKQAIETASVHLTINTAAIASQIRAIVADMLLAAGTPFENLDELLDFE